LQSGLYFIIIASEKSPPYEPGPPSAGLFYAVVSTAGLPSSADRTAPGRVGGVLLWLFQAFCISTLWGWFVVPVFHVAEISVVIAFGISMLISIFQDPTQQYKDKDWTEIIGIMVGRAVGLGFALLLGWVLHFYV
jgi:hypothetical protein